MKPRLIFCIVFLVFCIPGLVCSEEGPGAVSPGLDVGIAQVGEGCPTFSWTSVEWATGYRVTVFEASSGEVLSYEEMSAVAYPVLDKEIEGRALSWTPSSDEELRSGSVYVWYVQAMDAYGSVMWSAGKVFKVDVALRLLGMEERLRERMREAGVSEEVISEILDDKSFELNEVSLSGGYKTTDQIKIQGWDSSGNTWYGEAAGVSLTTGHHNTFIGYAAGRGTTTGHSNTFIGNRAGDYNTIGSDNTFMGLQAGEHTTTGYHNTFLGSAAGRYNTTGAGNVFLGHRVGMYETGSNRLYIDNSDTNSPLIYGEFDNDLVAINGKLGVGTQSPSALMEIVNPSGRSDLILNRTDGATGAFEAKLNNVSLGSLTAHSLKLIVGGDPKVTINTDGSLEMISGATCTAAGVWTDASSRAYKENIEDLSVAEAKDVLSELNPVKYNYKEDKEEEYLGFIAEDVPELVASKERKGMSPMDVVAVLTKVVQEQQDTIAELQARIAKLEEKPQ